MLICELTSWDFMVFLPVLVHGRDRFKDLPLLGSVHNQLLKLLSDVLFVFFSSFTERFGFRKQRQLFFDKLGSIYTVLCTILNMKLPKSGNMAIPYHLMKKLRADPFPTANLSKCVVYIFWKVF